jgi:hypothetical protein
MVSREEIYAVVREAIHRGLLRFSPPHDELLSQRIADRFSQLCPGLKPEHILVVDARSRQSGRHLAMAAAELTFTLIRSLGVRQSTVHLGIGGGRLEGLLARFLGFILRSAADDLRPLVVHALNAGLFDDHIGREPVSFARFLGHPSAPVAFEHLFAVPMFDPVKFGPLQRLPGVAARLESAQAIDVVVASIESGDDEHAGLRQFIGRHTQMQRLPRGAALRAESGRQWSGTVQCIPFSEKGPVVLDGGLRPFALLGLSDLLKLSHEDAKHVVLMAGQCPTCRKTPAAALALLLKNPSLKVWTHLAIDHATASELLA